MRVFELSGHVVRGEPVRFNGRLCVTWNAADPQPPRKVRSDKGKGSAAKRLAIVARMSSPTPVVIVARPSERDRGMVAQAQAAAPALQMAWMGVAA